MLRASKKLALICGLSGLGIAAATPAAADPFTYTAAYTFTLPTTPGGGNSVSSSTAPVDLLPSQAAGSNSIFGHYYGVGSDPLTIAGFGSRSSGTGNYTIQGSFRDDTSFTNTTGTAAQFTLTFLVTGGELRVSVPQVNPSITGSQTATIGEQILINNTTRFLTSATLSTTESTQATFSQSGAVLNPAGPSLATGLGSYSWDNYFGTIDLGVLQPNETVSISALATSSASGTLVSPLQSCQNPPTEGAALRLAAVEGGDGGDECFPDEGSATARIGDPSSFNGVAAFGPIVSIAVATPEPASAALVGAGMLALASFRRRKTEG